MRAGVNIARERVFPPPPSSLFDYTGVEGKEGDRKGGEPHMCQQHRRKGRRRKELLCICIWRDGGRGRRDRPRGLRAGIRQ